MLQPGEANQIAEFRPVYLRPSRLSDEAIAVGLLVSWENHINLIKVERPSAIFNLQTFYGQRGTDQVLFALSALREVLAGQTTQCPRLEHITSPTDLLFIGPKDCFSAAEPLKEGGSMLRALSSLYASDFHANQPARETVSQKDMLKKLRREVGRLNVFAGTDIFKGLQVGLPNRKQMKFPISGKSVVGDVVSFVTPNVMQAKLHSEANVVRLNFAHRRTNKRPALYILAPSFSDTKSTNLLDDSIEELRLITQEYEVTLREDKSIEELAHAVLKDVGVAQIK